MKYLDIGECNEWQNDQINDCVDKIKKSINGSNIYAIHGALTSCLAEFICKIASKKGEEERKD